MLQEMSGVLNFTVTLRPNSKVLTPALGLTPGLKKLIGFNSCFASEKHDVAGKYFVLHSGSLSHFVYKK